MEFVRNFSFMFIFLVNEKKALFFLFGDKTLYLFLWRYYYF